MARSGLAGGGQGEWLGMGVGSREFPMCGGGEGRGCASVVGGSMGGRKGGAWASGGLAVDLAGVVPGSQATRPCDGGGQKAHPQQRTAPHSTALRPTPQAPGASGSRPPRRQLHAAPCNLEDAPAIQRPAKFAKVHAAG